MQFLIENWISVVAILVSILSALYARWSYSESVKANNISRLNALLAFRSHYIELSLNEIKKSIVLKNSPSGMDSVLKSFADNDEKLREINIEIAKYHNSVIKNEL